MNKLQEQANIQRAEAKKLLLRHFRIRRDESNGEIERIVDCIVSAALLEVCAMQSEAIANQPTSDNP